MMSIHKTYAMVCAAVMIIGFAVPAVAAEGMGTAPGSDTGGANSNGMAKSGDMSGNSSMKPGMMKKKHHSKKGMMKSGNM